MIFDGFKEFVGVPENMRIDMMQKRVLIPTCRELTPQLFGLENPDRALPLQIHPL
ncbi:hypothetical protein [Helicobacter felis]|uniref:hypothetical protein n=1 Tax=Helicobacter felis TaxID=214 RepID=UPI001315A930|nr:hypothetical protein [Helicobacter felis]